MKPKDLKWSFSETLPIRVEDRIWSVPRWNGLEEDPFVFEGFGSDQYFGNEKPLYLEYCSGNGLWIAEKAKEQRGVNWVGVELKWKRIKKIWSKIQNEALDNLMAVHAEAKQLTQDYLFDSSIDKIFINFPDPWPKKRHIKHRLFCASFVEQLGRILKPGGTLTLVTDDEPYAIEAVEALLKSNVLKPLSTAPHYIHELDGYGSSTFEELWRQLGRKIYYISFQKSS